MTSSLDLALGQFHDDLQRARHLLRLVTEFRKFAASTLPAEVANGTVNWPEIRELAGAAPFVRTDLPILSGAILLYICGRFEFFIREVVVTIADSIAAKATSYSDVPDRLRREILTKTLEVAQNPKRYNYDDHQAEQFIVSLAKNLSSATASGTVEISSRLLSITESNMNSLTLAEVLKRVAITEFWVELGKQAPMRTHLEKVTDKDCTAEARSQLDEIMKERNGIAHPTGTVLFPDLGKVVDALEFLNVLARVIVDVVQMPSASFRLS